MSGRPIRRLSLSKYSEISVSVCLCLSHSYSTVSQCFPIATETHWGTDNPYLTENGGIEGPLQSEGHVVWTGSVRTCLNLVSLVCTVPMCSSIFSYLLILTSKWPRESTSWHINVSDSAYRTQVNVCISGPPLIYMGLSEINVRYRSNIGPI